MQSVLVQGESTRSHFTAPSHERPDLGGCARTRRLLFEKENATLVGVALVCGRFESPVGPSLPAPPGRKPSRDLARQKAGAGSDLLRRGNIFEVTEDRADDRRDVGGSGRPEDIDLGIVGETRINHHPH